MQTFQLNNNSTFSIYLAGVKHSIYWKFTFLSDIKVIHQNENLIFLVPRTKNLIVQKDLKKAITKRLIEWLKAKAHQILSEKVFHYSFLMNLKPKTLKITNSKTRWGSCSNRGIIRLHWRLVMLPNSVIDYVVIHELAHLKEFNHSKRFWNEVEKYCPDYIYQRVFLKSLANIPSYQSQYLFPERLISFE